MSHTVEWIDPIYDRTYADVLLAQEDPTLQSPKGCYNYVDLNRIGNNTRYVMEEMLDRKIIRVQPSLQIKTNWTENDIPTSTQIATMIQNVIALMNVSNPIIADDLDTLYMATQMNYALANSIEKNLEIMKNQPNLPIQKFLLKINHGIIVEYNSSMAEIEEDEIVHIQGVPYGENAQYQHFNHWSGETDDLQYVGDVEESPTTFIGQYHDVELTAEFLTIIPRTLTLINGYISPDGTVTTTGATTGTFYAGDEILIIANRAISGKAFYEWLGTQDAIENLTGGPEPSTSWLVMPDCDVQLQPRYINAGAHQVTVNNGSGGGWYDYRDYVNIYANDRGPKYQFAYWSGATGYLQNINSSSQSFQMGDENISFTANYSYVYSYNTVDVINGTINGQARGENLRESSGQSISATIPAGYGFDYWSLEGVGSFADYKVANTTFYVGDGNAIITAHFTALRNLTIVNQDNSGRSTTQQKTQNNSVTVQTSEIAGNYIFVNWTEDSTVKSTSPSYTFTMSTRDMTLVANYRLRNEVQVTIDYGNHIETVTMTERNSKTITADTISGIRFLRWDYSSIHSINNRYSSSTSFVAGSGNGTITAVFENQHTLTVHSGSGSGTYGEGSGITIDGNQPPSTYEFDYWSIDSGNGTIDNIYSKRTTYRMGTTDGEITAHYKPIPYFTLTVIDGTGSGTFIRNSSPTIQMNPAPEGKQFLQWEILEGDQNDVYQPLAETTYIRNLTHNVTVQATYYVPESEDPFVLTMTHKDGTPETSYHQVGEQFTIYADSPDEGYEFLKWTGDTQYLIGGLEAVYSENPRVNMPAKNIALGMAYIREGSTPTFVLELENGECLVSTYEDPETGEITETWDYRGEFEEGTVVPIRAIDIPFGFDFNGWSGTQESMSTVASLSSPNTTVTIPDYDVELTRDIIEQNKYTLTINNGEVGGQYYKDAAVSVYFGIEDTTNVHYNFIRWTGNDLAYIKLYSGGSFDIYESGKDPVTGEIGGNPQVIRMPARAITITGTYSTAYHLVVNGGTIDSQDEYFAENAKVNITANTVQGQKFLYWSGDTQYLSSIYQTTAEVTVPNRAITLTAVYGNNPQTDIGYTSLDKSNSTTIDTTDITVISGTIDVGFLLTDMNGHIYLVTALEGTTATIIRLTKISRGGNVYD